MMHLYNPKIMLKIFRIQISDCILLCEISFEFLNIKFNVTLLKFILEYKIKLTEK